MCVCYFVLMSRRVQGFVMKLLLQCRVELPLVQILVVVAIIQMRTLKTDVEKGSM